MSKIIAICLVNPKPSSCGDFNGGAVIQHRHSMGDVLRNRWCRTLRLWKLPRVSVAVAGLLTFEGECTNVPPGVDLEQVAANGTHMEWEPEFNGEWRHSTPEELALTAAVLATENATPVTLTATGEAAATCSE